MAKRKLDVTLCWCGFNMWVWSQPFKSTFFQKKRTTFSTPCDAYDHSTYISIIDLDLHFNEVSLYYNKPCMISRVSHFAKFAIPLATWAMMSMFPDCAIVSSPLMPSSSFRSLRNFSVCAKDGNMYHLNTYLSSQHKASSNILDFAYAIQWRHALVQTSRCVYNLVLTVST